MTRGICGVVGSLSLVLACGDDGRGDDGGWSASVSASVTVSAGSVSLASEPTSGATVGVSGEGTTVPTSGEGMTTSVEGTTGLKFDLGGQPDQGTIGGCAKGMGMAAFSFIWIANSVEGTVSKIDTRTGIEVGRYVSTPMTEGLGNSSNGPSRTSVNLYGDMAVSNRNGGVTKIAARAVDCVDTDGNGAVDTSTGPGDVKPWGQDECVLWHHPTPTAPSAYNEGPRPTAWVGEVDQDMCPVRNPRLWIGYYSLGQNLGVFERLDGATGVVLDEVKVPWSGQMWGPYGGAVNRFGDFFVTGWGEGPAIRIDNATLQATVFLNPPGPVSFYGMALDKDGELWVAGCGDSKIFHLDPELQQWTVVGVGPGCLRGIQIDTEGRAFIAHNGFPGGLVVVDTATKTILNPNVQLAGASTPVGVSIDVDGFVWVVDQGGWAFKVDPETYAVVLKVEGLNQPYTYSDMTGAGLNLVVNPPG